MLCGAGGPSPALHVNGRKSSDDRPSCLENPRPAGAESTLTENVASPFQAEPRHYGVGFSFSHRARAALLAISRSRSGLNFSALALPPFFPPNFPKATAAGFFRDLSGAPVAISTTLRAF